MGVNHDDLAALLQDVGTSREGLLEATHIRLDDLGGTIRDMVRDLRADAWRSPCGGQRRDDAAALAREVGELVQEHASAVAVLGALGEAPTPEGDADGSLLIARLDAALAAAERRPANDARTGLQAALDRIDRYAVAVSLKLGRPIPSRSERPT